MAFVVSMAPLSLAYPRLDNFVYQESYKRYASIHSIIFAKSNLNDLVKTITPFEHRKKRGLLDVGGVALKFLFGIVDSDDLLEINKKKDSLSHGSDGIVNIVKK